jgi:Tfp pilus assembly protein PilF
MDRIAKLRMFMEKFPDDHFSRHALAMELIKAGDDAAAATELARILEKDPSYIGSYYHLGKLHERQGDPEAAMKIYERGIAEAVRQGDRHAGNELRSALDAIAD